MKGLVEYYGGEMKLFGRFMRNFVMLTKHKINEENTICNCYSIASNRGM